MTIQGDRRSDTESRPRGATSRAPHRLRDDRGSTEVAGEGHLWRPPPEEEGWEDWPVLRETFVAQLGPGMDELGRDLARRIWTFVLEELPLRRYRETWIRTQLRAAAGDLRFLAGFLGDHIGEQGERSGLEEEDRRLTVRAAGWAAELETLAATIEGAVEGLSGSLERDGEIEGAEPEGSPGPA